MPFRFRFSWIPFIAAVIAVAIGIALGNWQSRRALEKEAIEASLQARAKQPTIELGTASLPDLRDLEFRRVRVKGRFVGDWPVYLDNRPYERRAGFHLLMPFRIAGSDTVVLVARGWLPRDPYDRARLPITRTPTGEVEIEGSVRLHASRVYQFGEAAPLRPGAIVQNVTTEEFAAASGLKLYPFLIEQAEQDSKGAAYDDGLVRDWPRPSLGAEKHRAYAFQWYGLAAAALLFFLITGFRRGTKQ
ncbi:cytochrome oxidase assembly protein ShyY1 [Paucimonas lemoignei]|uniref:SURF1-like protein n=1 Tax=Paucimonas lemoignei TaxID=29443 RepID=A0A4V2UIP8_PAULE|nr:SURF1 family protein [Paucimonas lemoignei]TCS37030.1 cytochrome oxidase assembly protein ShyY1 [Paucimonas lemoignei]